MNGKFSCKGCPLRTPYCHSTCEKYLAEKAEYEKLKLEHDQKMHIEHGLWDERTRKVIQSNRYKRKRWGNY